MKAWSFSALSSYETCPKKFFHEKIARDIQETQSSVGSYGSTAHQHFENRLIHGKPLPIDLRHHEKALSKLDARPGEGLPEQKIAINANFEPTGFFDADVWCRGVIDYVKLHKSAAIIVDHKFGKMKDDFTQLDLMSALLFCVLPEIQTIGAAFYWAKNKKLTNFKRYARNEITNVWNELLPRVERLQRSIEKEDFPARPNGLCRRYCGVVSCPYHGG